ncbi:TNF receptor-associated factor 6-B-like isoform X3 [Clytia hemisphaerica]|uniref:TNF receptor-associated factor 6-B-like isoform X3 n=1 Tax=Clytia hemisphaerica TaxID=252671 RepID=UPI0034D472B8
MSQKGGYKLNFVHRQPDNTICSICRLVLCNPMQAERCGHRYCKSCLYDLPKRNGFHICPQDGSEMKLFQDNAKQMEILELLVKCPNNQSGSCNWIKELRHLRSHLKVCTEVPVSCQDCYQDAIPKSRIGIHRSKECTRRKIFEAMEIQLKDQTAEMKKLQDIIRQQKVEIDQHKTENQMLKKKVYHQEQTMSTLKRDQEDMCGKFNRICNVIRK